MKIPSVFQVREIDKYTIENEPITSIDLMERASLAVFNRMETGLTSVNCIRIFCGTGNNGGDGLALARMFIQRGFDAQIYHLKVTENASEDFKINLSRLLEVSVNKVYEINDLEDIPEIHSSDIVVDAIFGSGLNKRIQGISVDIIETINKSGAVVMAIDIPSGLMADKPINRKKDVIIQADYTFSFQFPKLAFLFPENEIFVGRWEFLPIGLHSGFIEELKVNNNMLLAEEIRKIVHKRAKFSHKGDYGHALLIAGSAGKTGAAILAGKACLRTGAGLLHVHLPSSALIPIQASFPEAMVSIDTSDNQITEIPDLSKFSAIGIGPGIGTHENTAKALKILIHQTNFPLIIDADALNILSENKTWLAFLPKGSILTPHPREFERLAGNWSNSFERLQMQRDMSVKFNLVIVLKGAHTSITCPDGNCWFNSTGNPGMATAGSGDVLTGIILGLMAQKYTSIEAAKLGVYLHGLAGDITAEERGFESLIASDIIKNIGKAYKKLEES